MVYIHVVSEIIEGRFFSMLNQIQHIHFYVAQEVTVLQYANITQLLIRQIIRFQIDYQLIELFILNQTVY